MKRILTFLLLMSSIAFGQQNNTTNTNFTNGLGSSKFFNIPRGTVQPTTGILAGSLFYHTTLGLQYYSGSSWITLGILGDGVTSFNSRIGAITPLIGDYSSFYVPTTRTITINGATRDLSLNRTFNVGTVTSVGATAGTGISVSGSPITSSGSLTITNTAPDQTVVLTAGTGISATGTYPNFTITNTRPSVTITVTGTTDASGNFNTTAQGGTAQLIAVFEGAVLTRPEYNSSTKVLSAMNPLTVFTAYFK